MKNLKNKLMKFKIYIQRAMSWISILNAGMLLFLVFSTLEKYGYDINMRKYLIPIFLATLGIMFILGYIEDKLELFNEENRIVSEKNPYFTDISKKLERIEDKINKIESKK